MLTRREWLASGLLLPIAWRRIRRAQASLPDPNRVRLESLSQFNAALTFELDPPASGWVLERGGPNAVYRSGEYRLDVEVVSPRAAEFQVRFRLRHESGRAFTVRRYAVQVQKPFADIHRVWHYQNGAAEVTSQFLSNLRALPSGGETGRQSAANTGMPLMLCTDREGQNRLSFGLMDQVETTTLGVDRYEVDGQLRNGLNYRMTFAKPYGYELNVTSLSDGFWLNAAPVPWFDALEAYAGWVRTSVPIRPLPPPPAAFEPIWCSWYPFGLTIDEATIDAQSTLCREAGINTILIDAGYQTAVTGELATSEAVAQFSAHTGDWTADPGKFPDLKGLVARLHARGQRVTAWIAPFNLGKATRTYASMRDALKLDGSGHELDQLCPQHPRTPGHLAAAFREAAEAYDFDGYWLDFMDVMHLPCHASHTHAVASPGEGYNRCLAALRDAVLAYKPNFLLETRMKMANLNVQQYINVLETTDMPVDYDINRALGVFVRGFAGGSAVKLDPMQWHPEDRVETVAKACATVVCCGVPVFSCDLTRLPADHRRVMAAWMGFYRTHQAALMSGRLTPTTFEPYFPHLQIASGATAFLYVGASTVCPADLDGRSDVYVINATDKDDIGVEFRQSRGSQWKCGFHDGFLRPASHEQVNLGAGSALFRRRVPQGGLLHLERLG